MPIIFISYRREDTEQIAGRIYDHLKQSFGSESLFMDINSIPVGADFREHLINAIGECDVLLVLIGKKWLEIDQAGKCRLENPEDFVRIEIEEALNRKKPVIPVLIGTAKMPRFDELPPTLAAFSYRNAAHIDVGRDFNAHIERLILSLKEILPSDSLATSLISSPPRPRSKSELFVKKLRESLKEVNQMQLNWDQEWKNFEPLNSRIISLIRAKYSDIAEEIVKRQHDLASVNDMIPYFLSGVQEAIDRMEFEEIE